MEEEEEEEAAEVEGVIKNLRQFITQNQKGSLSKRRYVRTHTRRAVRTHVRI